MPKSQPLPLGRSVAHRNKFEVSVDRLMKMSPTDLHRFADEIAKHDAGEYVIDILQRAFKAKQGKLPETK